MKSFVLAMVALVACTPPRANELTMPPIDPTRMSHDQHAQIPCTSCHRANKRPGADDHKPCDDPACHRKEFLAKPALFCQVCHEPIKTLPLEAKLKPYPIENAWQSEPPKFSHKKHLDNGRMEGAVGFHVACVDCHMRGDTSARPDHATCSRCHADEVGAATSPKMEQCKSCHEPKLQPRTRGRLIHDDLRPFAHERHRTDRRGEAIRCEQCHAKTSEATSYDDHAAPRIATCVGCHDDTDRTPETMQMRICEICHTNRTSRITAIAPRNHLPATERPLDHTLAFRRDHAEAAERDAARCAACHTQMSGNAQQACDECHQTMRPSDHRITWRELDHGTEAIADRTRCARCHVIEFCNACHSQRPRSHGFAGSFVTDHGPLARINVQPCITCHQESYCLDCHRNVANRRGVK
jgi:hypothetical protein